jgi:hypothetical protein
LIASSLPAGADSGEVSWDEVNLLLKQGQALVSKSDLRALHVHRNWIAQRVAREELTEVHPKVLALPDLEMDLMARFRAALLQMGPRALLSHTSALELFGVLRDYDHDTVHVTMP